MRTVSIRELRNRGGEIVEAVERGQTFTVTRAGKPVAELRPLSPAPMTAETLLDHWSRLPPLDSDELRRDIDRLVDIRL